MLKSVAVLVLLLIGLAGFGWVVLRQLRERIAIERALHQAHQTLKAMALNDSLTGLGNRRRLDAVLEPEIRRARRQGHSLALVMLDLDYFKLYNDRYGHPAGMLACGVSASCCARRSSARGPGGALWRGGVHAAAAGHRHSRRQPDRSGDPASVAPCGHRAPGQPVGAGVRQCWYRGGCALAGARVTPENLITAADEALYTAKRQGRDRYCVAGSVPVAARSNP